MTISKNVGDSGKLALIHSFAGLLGGVGSLAISYPLLTVALRLQIQSKKKNEKTETALEVIRNIFYKQGWRQVYAGLKPAIIGNAIAQWVFYYWYDFFLSVLKKF